MGRIFVVLAIFVFCQSAEAAVWGRYYISNDAFGHCGDTRLSPDIRIANCEKSAERHLLNLRSELFELDSLANAFGDKSDYPDAVMVFSKAVALAGRNEIPYQQFLRGMVYLRWGKADLAIADFNAVAAQGNDIYSYKGLAEVAATDGRYDDAINLYNKALALKPGEEFLLDGRANIYARMGDYAKAMADNDTIVENYHSESFPYNSRCWNRAISNRDIDGALADCTHALDLLPDDPDVLDSLGLVLFRQRKWDDAITNYTAALSHNPYFSSSFYMRGVSELRKGDTIKGHADIDHAKAINPQIGMEYAVYGIAP